jgi:hypothetical protein
MDNVQNHDRYVYKALLMICFCIRYVFCFFFLTHYNFVISLFAVKLAYK